MCSSLFVLPIPSCSCRAGLPADIVEKLEEKTLKPLGLAAKCLGGGRIEHYPDAKLLKVYGHSTVSAERMGIVMRVFK